MADAALALDRGDRQANLEALLKASATAPGDRYVKVRLGLAYLGLRRYQEAISIYETLLVGAVSVDPAAARDLAKAYIGIRDEGNAARVLRWGGIAESEVSSELSALRKALR